MTPAETDPREPLRIVQDEITDVLGRIAPQAYADVRDEFREKERRWFFSGEGRSGLIARMAAMRFMHLGYSTHVVGEATAPAVRAGDGILLVSGSGETPVSRLFAETAKAEGARLVVVTAAPDSRLARMADVALVVPVRTSRQFGGSLFEQCALILLDGIALSLAAGGTKAHAAMARRHSNMQ